MAGKRKRRWQLWASAAALAVGAGLLALVLMPADHGLPPRSEARIAGVQPHRPAAPSQPDRHYGEDALAPLIEQATSENPSGPKPPENDPEAMTPAEPSATAVPNAATPLRPAPRGQPAWRRNALPSAPANGQPMIAIVIDDMGLDRKRSAEVMTLPAPLTLSFMTYADDLATQTATGRAHGDEIMLHMPMEPQARHVDPGPNALLTGLDDAELRRRVIWGLGRIDGIVGVNNHMGSKFTESQPDMTIVLEQLRARGLFFLDSRTTPHSVGLATARQMGVASVGRDIFLDNFMTDPEVARELAQTEAVARRNGVAIAIGHPHDATIAELRRWLPTAAARGFRLVPVSAIVARAQAPAAPMAKTGG